MGADAGGGILPEVVMRRLRVCDRTVGTIALLSSVYSNSNSLSNTALSVLAVVSSLCWLAKGRAVARAEPLSRWKYLLLHATWHAWGAAALVAVTVRAQDHV